MEMVKKKKEEEEYDYIIVGAGIAGLHTGISLKKKHPRSSVIILERFNYYGGRVVSYKHTVPGVGKVQWENGAGRIHAKNHPLIMKYMKRYRLTFSPIDGDLKFAEGGIIRKNIFENTYIPMMRGLICSLGESGSSTIKRLMAEIVGVGKSEEILGEFAYNSEVDTLRADVALQVFEREMGSNTGFGVCKEGLSALIDGMVKDFEGLGGEILKGIHVRDIDVKGREVIYKEGSVKARSAIILALHVDALRELPCLKTWNGFSQVAMRPLLRVYAVFKGEPFKGLGKIVVGSVGGVGGGGGGGSDIRYFIPMSSSIAMVSYTDGPFAEKWIKVLEKEGQAKLCSKIMEGLRSSIPGLEDIEDPIFFKAHPWKSGCSYWLPGQYNVAAASVAAHTPFSNGGNPIYICGESFSLRQAWMEGALEHAESLFKNIDI